MRTTFDTVVKNSDVRGRFQRIIGACTGGGLLLTRYHIFDNQWFGVYLHRLNQSDEERAPHDHPWSFISVLLTSGYTEVTPVFCSVSGGCTPAEDKRWYHRFSILYRPAEYIHRLELVKPTWTLVLRGPERRTWGFWVVNPTNRTRHWMHHVEYGEKFCE